jgi:hypothetical protein
MHQEIVAEDRRGLDSAEAIHEYGVIEVAYYVYPGRELLVDMDNFKPALDQWAKDMFVDMGLDDRPELLGRTADVEDDSWRARCFGEPCSKPDGFFRMHSAVPLKFDASFWN